LYRRVARQVEPDNRAPARRAFQPQHTVGLPHETISLAQSKSRTLAERLCRKERLESACPSSLVHPYTGVSHADLHIFARRGPLLRHVNYTQVHILGGDGQLPALRHGVTRVYGEIEQHALQLVWVTQHRPNAVADTQLDRDTRSDRAPDQLRHIFYKRIRFDRHELQCLPARKGEQPMCESGGAFHHFTSCLRKPRALCCPSERVNDFDTSGFVI
jgi:hypothetical protein